MSGSDFPASPVMARDPGDFAFNLKSFARFFHLLLSKLGSGCYGVDRRCGVAEVKGVAELLGYGVEWRSGVGGVRS